MEALNDFFHEEGLFTFTRWGSFMCNPPLCISEDELRGGFEVVDRGLDVVDEYFDS